MKGLYFSSIVDVLFDENPMERTLVFSVLLGIIFVYSFLQLLNLLPSVVIMVVFESPVRSGFLMPKGLNRNRNRSAFCPLAGFTAVTHKKTADRGFLRSLDRFWSSSVLTGL